MRAIQAFALKVAQEEQDIEAEALALIEMGACYAATFQHSESAKYYGMKHVPRCGAGPGAHGESSITDLWELMQCKPMTFASKKSRMRSRQMRAQTLALVTDGSRLQVIKWAVGRA